MKTGTMFDAFGLREETVEIFGLGSGLIVDFSGVLGRFRGHNRAVHRWRVVFSGGRWWFDVVCYSRERGILGELGVYVCVYEVQKR